MVHLDAPPAKSRHNAISVNALILMAAFAALAFALARLPDTPKVLTFAFVVVGWIVSVMIHEFCHAFVAHKAGDVTVAEKGYLTLDPLKYTDLSTSLVLPLAALALGGIGFPGGAVYLRDDLMRTRLGRSLASLAGPLGTLLVMICLAVGLGLDRASGVERNALTAAASFLAFLQGWALILNLLPLPGLDGFGVIRPWLPAELQQKALRLGNLVFIGLFLAIFFVAPVSGLFWRAAFLLAQAFGIHGPDVGAGYQAFRFWA
ncbi:MAG: site-2 protease family protein [Caulobacter sp.]|nr:site-2 protease family protein [Caulobacter sp.]